MARIVFAFLCCFFASAQTPPGGNFESLFRDGLAAYQTKAYDKAQDAFGQALAIEPGNTAAMANYALSAFQQGQKGLAIAYFRKALALEPDLSAAKDGLRFALKSLDVKEIPHRIEAYETLRSEILTRAPARVFLALTALFLLAAGWLALGWAGARRRALRSEDVAPPFPMSAAGCLILAIAGLFLTSVKLYDATLPRGTILGKTVAALSAPAETGVRLFDLHEGFEVLIQDVQKAWVQVTYPGGLTGWIPKKELVPADGSNE